MLPVCVPIAVALGAKVTLTLQEAPAPTEAPHPVSTNSVLLLEMVIGIEAFVLFCTAKVCALLVEPWPTEPNVSEVGETVIGTTPVPVRVAVCGLPTPV